MRGLTERQVEVLEYISATIRDRGYPPTIREIGEALQIRSTNGVNDHLKALERKGFIDRSASKSRAILVTGSVPSESDDTATSVRRPAPAGGPSFPDTLSIPVLGRIAAGLPIEAIEEADEHVQIDPSLVRMRGGAPVFALRVEGESMIGDGIFDGDLIFVRRQPDAAQGEIVAVMVGGSATVKRFYRERGRIRLDPSNPTMEPIYVDSDSGDVAVLGKVVGVYRQVD